MGATTVKRLAALLGARCDVDQWGMAGRGARLIGPASPKKSGAQLASPRLRYLSKVIRNDPL
jgi:hypothetical protein